MEVLVDNDIDNFIDIEFPPTLKSIHDPDENYPFEDVIVWKRPKDFLVPERGSLQIYSSQIKPSDVVVGKLGDAWFTGALACLAEKPSLVDKLFITKNPNEAGLYKIQICKGGIWQDITIDDYIPCGVSSGGMALFSKTKTSDLWVMLLEKAYAKVHRNYATLRGGLVSEALYDLTGMPT